MSSFDKIDVNAFPPSLKKIFPYLLRAKEISKRDPIISYYCLSYSVEMTIRMAKTDRDLQRDKDAMKKLHYMMNLLEVEKRRLKPNLEEGRAVVEVFALKLYNKAEALERAGSKTTVLKKLYLMASFLMDITEQFENGISEDLKEKREMCRMKAAILHQIIKGIIPPEALQQMNEPAEPEPQQPAEPEVESSDDELELPEAPDDGVGEGDISDPKNDIEDDDLESRLRNLIGGEDGEGVNDTPNINVDFPKGPPKLPSIPTVQVIPKKRIPGAVPVFPVMPVMPQAVEVPKQESKRSFGGKGRTVDTSNVSQGDVAEAKKMAEYALSSLNFEDVKSGRKFIIDALNKLGGM